MFLDMAKNLIMCTKVIELEMFQFLKHLIIVETIRLPNLISVLIIFVECDCIHKLQKDWLLEWPGIREFWGFGAILFENTEQLHLGKIDLL